MANEGIGGVNFGEATERFRRAERNHQVTCSSNQENLHCNCINDSSLLGAEEKNEIYAIMDKT